MTQIQIEPIDKLIKEGFAKQITRQFRAPAVYTASVDTVRSLQKLQGNDPVEYPYIFLNVQQWSAASDRYNPNRLARQGVPVLLNSNGTQFQMARVIPVNFDIELEFRTNKYDGIDTTSVDGIARRWMFMRRNGSINFTVNYGLQDFPVTYTAGESLPLPPRESPTDQEPVYKIVGTITVQGYISEPVLGTRGRVNQVILSDAVPTLGQRGERFFPFPNSK
jgi:hypothetical protein